MCSDKNENKILILDDRGPEKMVLASILGRLGYQVSSDSSLKSIRDHVTLSPHLVIINSGLESSEEAALSIASQGCRVILLSPPHENAPDFRGFVDATEHLLRGIGVTIPEIVMVVNDFISPLPGKSIKRQPRVSGGYKVDVIHDGVTVEGFIFNLSATGAFVELSHPPDRHTELTLEFHLPGHETLFSFKSMVTWRVLPEESKAMRSPPGCGVYFMNMSESEHATFEEFVIHKGRA
ncbi:PilZ domain-containing protein [Myxococcota bacterium]|nr:PilZ domain-containing protein [Myxococcota bacterium]MBU1538004.1 PilZ domain-containing protein [Myxococcota bacterium]